MKKINELVDIVVRNDVVCIVIIVLGIVWIASLIYRRFLSGTFIKYEKLQVETRHYCDRNEEWIRKVHWTDRVIYLLIPWKKTCTLKARGLPKIKVKVEEGVRGYLIVNEHPYFYILWGNSGKEKPKMLGDYFYMWNIDNFATRYSDRNIINIRHDYRRINPTNTFRTSDKTLLIYDQEYEDIWILLTR